MALLTDVSSQTTLSSSPSEPETTTIELRVNGDAVILVEHKRFIVSSEILQIASDYFKALFSPNLHEGQMVRNGGLPEIVLHDDDPEAMEIILSILHYRLHRHYDQPKPEMILKVAQHSDKYQIKEPLRPWATSWMKKKPSNASVKDYDYLLSAALVFGDKERLKKISESAIRNLPQNFNASDQDELFLPQALQIEIVRKIKDTVEDIRYEMESGIEYLGQSSSVYTMIDGQKMCIQCDRIMPVGAKKCHPCRNSNLELRRCTSRTRKVEYVDFLRSLGFWPARTVFTKWSVVDIAKTFHNANRNCVNKCSAGEDCPLRVLLGRLDGEIQKIVNEKIEGLQAEL